MERTPRHKKTQLLKEIIFISIGVISACFGLKSFLLPSGFIDGGVTGISLLISKLTGLDLSYLIILVNIPFVLLGFKQMGTTFAIKTSIAIVMLSLSLVFIPFAPITHDKLLIAFFGGFFLGGGIGLAMRGGCVIDGTEILALYISKNSMLTVGNIILLLNIIIFSFAAALINIETALYAILTYFAASKTLDGLVNGLDQFIGVTIISKNQEAIKAYIIEDMHRGVTIYKGAGGYGEKNNIEILFTAVTRLEMSKLQHKISDIDADAFVVQQQLSDLKGGVVKKSGLH